MWTPAYHFLSYTILARIIAPLQPFALKQLTNDLTVIEIIFVYALISFILAAIAFLFIQDHTRNVTLLKKIKNGKILHLLLFIGLVFLFTNAVKLCIYKNESIVRARPTLTALGLIATLLWGIFYFKEKITKKIIAGTLLLLLAVCILAS